MNPLRAHLCSAARRSSQTSHLTRLRQRLCHERFGRRMEPAKRCRGGSCRGGGGTVRSRPGRRPCPYSERRITLSKSQIPNNKPPIPNTKLALGIWDLGFGICLREPERHFDGGATRASSADGDPSPVCQHNLLNDSETKARAAGTRREEGPEDFFALAFGNPRSVVFDGDAARAVRAVDSTLDDDRRRAVHTHAGFSGITQQVAEHLPQENFVAFDCRELTLDVDSGTCRQLVPKIVAGSSSHSFQVDSCNGKLLRPREIQEVGDNLTERFRLLPNAFNVGAVLRGKRLRIEQTTVAVNGRETVA